MSDTKRIAVRTCGGCFCQFDRRRIYTTLSETFAPEYAFQFSYNKSKDDNFEMVVLINGCDSECAEASELVDNLVIDHTNWERATEVFREKVD